MYQFFSPHSRLPLKEFSFKLPWKGGVEVQLDVDTTGRVKIRNALALSELDRVFFNKVVDKAAVIARSNDRQGSVQQLQRSVAARRSVSARIGTSKTLGLMQEGEDPYDRYWLSSATTPPEVFVKFSPAFNVGLNSLSAFFLIPLVATSYTGLSVAVSVSFLAMMSQLGSGVFERKLGPVANRRIQDTFSAVTLSVSTFSSTRVLSAIFLNRILQLANLVDDTEAEFIIGVFAITLACVAVIGACFVPSVAVMGPRTQAAAIRIERKCLKQKSGDTALSLRENLLEEFKKNEGASLADRVLCQRYRSKTTLDYRSDERMINAPTLLTALLRLASAWVSSEQVSIAFGVNRGVPETFLLPMAVLSLLHPFVSRDIIVNFFKKPLFRIPAMSDRAPLFATGLKYTSEACGVGYNSILYPLISSSFVLEGFLGLGNTGFETTKRFSGADAAVLASLVAVNIPSLMLDLSSRRLGIDRFEGWSASRLRYIAEESQTAGLRKELGSYLQLLIQNALAQERSQAAANTQQHRPYATPTVALRTRSR